jgi:hypothetical protein
MTLNDLYKQLKEEGREIAQAARAGNEKARRVIEAYRFHYACPGDPGGQALLMIAYEEYKKVV